MAIIPTDPSHPFPVQNLPFGAGHLTAGGDPHCISRIGDHIINLAALEEAGHFASILPESNVFSQPTLNKFMACDKSVWQGGRAAL